MPYRVITPHNILETPPRHLNDWYNNIVAAPRENRAEVWNMGEDVVLLILPRERISFSPPTATSTPCIVITDLNGKKWRNSAERQEEWDRGKLTCRRVEMLQDKACLLVPSRRRKRTASIKPKPKPRPCCLRCRHEFEDGDDEGMERHVDECWGWNKIW